jgi:hypothetical protein
VNKKDRGDMRPTVVERLRALLHLGDRRIRHALGIGRRAGSLLMKCAGCNADLGILEPKIGVGAWGFCSWVCVEAALASTGRKPALPHRLVLTCAGCAGIFGMAEPSDEAYGKASLFFCEASCMRDYVSRGHA